MTKANQLRLLLWKNLLIKRRQPIVLALELCLPLVLFAILGVMRHENGPLVTYTKTAPSRPLPSAGIIPVMQVMCNQAPDFPTNPDGLPMLSENSTLHFLLEHFDKLTRDFTSLQPITNTTIESMLDKMVKHFEQSMDELMALILNNADTSENSTIISHFNSLNISKSFEDYESLTTQLEIDMKSMFKLLWPSSSSVQDAIYSHDLESFPLDKLLLEKNITALPFLNDSLRQYDPSDYVEAFSQLLLDDFAIFTKFFNTLDDVSKIILSLHLSDCNSQHHNYSNSSSNFEEKNNIDFRFARTIQPILCQNPTEDEEPLHVGRNDNMQEYADGIYDHQLIFSLSKWKHVLKNQPRILFAPANSSASLVIKKVNRTIELVDQVTILARYWQSDISVQLHGYFSQSLTDVKLQLLQQLQQKLEALSHEKHEHAKLSRTVLNFFEVVIKNSTKIELELDAIDNAACIWIELMSKVDLDIFRPFSDENEATSYALREAYNDNVTVVAIIAFDVNTTDGSLLPHTSYKIRMNSTFLPSTRRIRPVYWSPIPRNWDFFYYYSGFSFLQDMVDRAIIDIQVGHEVIEPGTYTTNAPMPCYLYDTFLFTISNILPLCMTLSFVYTTAILAQNIVFEKEHRLKEFMKVMGLSNTAHGFVWFVTAFAQLTFSMSIVTVMLRYLKILLHSNPVIIWLLLEIYALATIAFAFLISSLFSKAKIAAATTGMLYILSYVPAMYIGIREHVSGESVQFLFKQLACLLSTSAFGICCKYISLRESEGVGVHWKSIAVSPIEHDSFSLLHALAFLALDCVLYAILGWYIEQIHPGSFGVPKPWHFPFTFLCKNHLADYETSIPRMWLLKSLGSFVHRNLPFMANSTPQLPTTRSNDDFSNNDSTDTWEQEPTDLLLGVEIDKLTKRYKQTGKLAVNQLSLRLYESQITGLLGHNGAGKSSVMSILTGTIPPTSGTAKIYGRDITKDLDIIRKSVGFCPQHNVLFEQLTPEEHLKFYSGLKSNGSSSDADIDQMLQDVGLTAKQSTSVKHLSGGMKRKLSIAIAFIGNSRLVILDEPTAGVDPYARRAIWDLLSKYKHKRTILLATHHLDEADVLADRIAIMSDGCVRSCGSSVYLRNKFCQGYHLVCVKQLKDKFRKSSPDGVSCFIKNILPSAYLQSENKHELHYILPYKEETDGNFITFFKRLDESLLHIGLISYGVYDSALEEAFLEILRNDTPTTSPGCYDNAALENDERFVRLSETNVTHNNIYNRHSRQSSAASANGISCIIENGHEKPRNTVKKQQSLAKAFTHFYANSNKRFIELRHFRALLIKRLLFVRRNWKVLFSQTILPAIFISAAMSIALSAPSVQDPPPFDLSPSQYYDATSPIGLFTPIANYEQRRNTSGKQRTNVGQSDASATEIAETIRLISGVAATCTLKSVNINTFEALLLASKSSSNMSIYFNKKCNDAFTEGVSLSYFDPKAQHHATSSQPYYPECYCASDFTGFVCRDDYNKPPVSQLISGDYVVDIGSQGMVNYLLYTTDEYRRHRYGAVAFGGELSFVPTEFGSHIDNGIRRLAVRQVSNFFFDNRGYHSLPAYLNVVNNAILRGNVGKQPRLGNPAAYGITTYNHPINGTDRVFDLELILQGTDLIVAIFIICAMSFVPASFVVFLVYERSLLVKHSQIMAGLHPVMYWLTNFFWDILNYFVPAVCCIVILVIFSVPAYVTDHNLQAVVLLFLLYGWAMTPMMYPTSFYFKEASKAYVALVVFNLVVGTTCLMTTFLLDRFYSSPNMNLANHILKTIFLAFPPYCLGRGMMNIAINHYQNMFYTISEQSEKIESPFTWETTIQNYVAMFVEGFLFFGLTVLLEAMARSKSHALFRWPSRDTKSEDSDDVDVAAERKRVITGGTGDDILVIKELTKTYSTRQGTFLALDRLSLGLARGECFGLIGPNGAGKSTTFSLLSDIIAATMGEACVDGKALSGKCMQLVGFCPQTDPLLEELTAREHLQLFSRIRGISSDQEENLVSWLLERTGLELYSDKPSRTYSGGTKRKLSAALALLGNPQILLLDEPTTGMDPASRRFLWDLILELRADNRLVVLTSHSMEECEILCSRLGIMATGKLQCLGSTQQLKHKFGNGYKVTIRLPFQRSGHSRSEITNTIKQAFDRADISPASWRLMSQHHQTIEIALLNSSPDLGAIFGLLNDLRRFQTVGGYSISQNKLDNVFLKLAHKSKKTTSRQQERNGNPKQVREFHMNEEADDFSTAIWVDDQMEQETHKQCNAEAKF